MPDDVAMPPPDPSCKPFGRLRDAELAARLRAGDRDAFTALHERYNDLVFRLARNRTGRRDEAEDATQETFLRVWEKRKELVEGGRIASWILAICANWIRDNHKSKTRFIRDGGLTRRSLDDADALVVDVLPEHRVVKEEQRQAVLTAAGNLPRELKEVLILRQIEGLGREEIAGILGKPLRRVKALLSKAHDDLRSKLEPQPAPHRSSRDQISSHPGAIEGV